ncbi:MAG: hypothetical protein RR619_05030 [Raoultibacter sp.]
MKKSNWIIAIVLVVVSAFLHIDKPLDLVLSIVWWAVVVLAIVLIIRSERVRKERIRSMYVANDAVFNSEAGVVQYAGSDQLVAVMNRILRDLDYGFTKQETPDDEGFSPVVLVKTARYGKDDWVGSIVAVGSKEERSFNNKEELSALLRGCCAYKGL